MVDWDTLIEELNNIGTEAYANLSTPTNSDMLYATLVWDNITETKETVDNIVNSAFEGQFWLKSTLENNQYKAAVSEYSGPAR